MKVKVICEGVEEGGALKVKPLRLSLMGLLLMF